jgi:hypothetical protein
LAGVAEATAKIGDITAANRVLSSAHELTKSIFDPYTRVEALSVITWTMAEIGNALEARRLADKGYGLSRAIKSDFRRDVAVVLLVAAQALSGAFEEALFRVSTINSPFVGALGLAFVAEAQSKSYDTTVVRGTIDKAMNAVRTMKAEVEISQSLAFIAWAMPNQID